MNLYKLNKRTFIITLEEIEKADKTWVFFIQRKAKGFNRLVKKGRNTKTEMYFDSWEQALTKRNQLIRQSATQHRIRMEKLLAMVQEEPAKPEKIGLHIEKMSLRCTICEKVEHVNPSGVTSTEKKEFICIDCIEYERKRQMKKTNYTSEDVNAALHIVRHGKLSIITRSAKRGGAYLLSLRQDERKRITGKLCSDMWLKELFEL